MAEDLIRHRKRKLHHTLNLDVNSHNDAKDYSFSIGSNNHQQQQQSIYGRKKTETLICSICEGPAHGYNFDAITCESCKAFFRRNALKGNEKLKCRMNDGRCTITVATRKRCKACRLTKCLEQGMRADWILTDEERINKRKKIEENRRLRRLLYPDSSDSDEANIIKPKNEPIEYDDDDFNEPIKKPLQITLTKPLLSSDDLIKIQRIQQAYTDSVRLTSLPRDVPSYPNSISLTAPSEMINVATNILTTRLITYYKLLEEFSSLNEQDKLILIKYNVFALAFIRAALNYDPANDSYHEFNTDECVFAGRDLIQCFSYQQYADSTRCVRNLLRASSGDRLLLQIMLIIMMFSKGSTICTFANEKEPIAQNTLKVFDAQNVYVSLLWKYCENKFGFTKAVSIWSQLTMTAMDAHLQAFKTREDYIKVDSVIDQLSPLMKSVMLVI